MERVEKTDRWVAACIDGHWTGWYQSASHETVSGGGVGWLVIKDGWSRTVEYIPVERVWRLSVRHGATAPDPLKPGAQPILTAPKA